MAQTLAIAAATLVAMMAPPAPAPRDLGWEAYGIPPQAVPSMEALARRHVRLEGKGLDEAAVFRVLLGFTPARREALAKQFGAFRTLREAATELDATALMMIVRLRTDKDWHQHRELVDQCTARAHGAREPARDGVALLRFVIDPEGAVVEPSVAKSTVRSATFDRCLAEVARSLIFPPPADRRPVVVSYKAFVRARRPGLIVDGFGLDGRQVGDELGARQGELRACHDRALAVDPYRALSVTLKFTIAPDGTVEPAVPRAPRAHADEVACLLDVLRGITFRRPSDREPVTVEYSLAFPPRK